MYWALMKRATTISNLEDGTLDQLRDDARGDKQTRPRCMLSPDSKVATARDIVVMLAVLSVCVVTPFELGFVESIGESKHPLAMLFFSFRCSAVG